MARPSKLTVSQCELIRRLRADGLSALDLSRRFKVSESSLYKVLDGSYTARADDAPQIRAPKASSLFQPEQTAPAQPVPDAAPLQSLFSGDQGAPRLRPTQLNRLLVEAAQTDLSGPVDEVTLAAAELVVARAKLNQALAHAH